MGTPTRGEGAPPGRARPDGPPGRPVVEGRGAGSLRPVTLTDATMPPPPPGVSGAAARAIDAVKVYGQGETEVRALDGITVAFDRNRFTAIMGPSGSGKSTLMHCIAGLDTLTSGQVFIGDVELGRLSEKELTQLRRDTVGFVFQAFNLVPTLTAAENITLPMDLAGRKPDRAWYDTVIDTVDLRDRLGHRPSELSGGQQQRVAVARALASRPQIIFADEPTGNLDSRSGSEILTFMRRAVDDFGQTIVMVTHDATAAGFADRVVFLADGRIVDEMHDPTAEAVLDRIKRYGE
jgi:putative ABC transport system ATP-binding protein